ncbi:MAG: hypothetical protein C1941_00140 [Prosthecochloris sp.]|nr:hypothetical protein [Prosthecochloris sp.]
MKDYDTIISGAGSASCSAALSLARKGYRVLLLDQERFPRDNICGDGLSPASVLLLEDLGIIDSI